MRNHLGHLYFPPHPHPVSPPPHNFYFALVFMLSFFISFVLSGVPWPSPCPSPSSRPPRYQSAPTSLPPRAATPTRPPARPPSRSSRAPSHPSDHGSPAPVSTLPKRMSSEGTKTTKRFVCSRVCILNLCVSFAPSPFSASGGSEGSWGARRRAGGAGMAWWLPARLFGLE